MPLQGVQHIVRNRSASLEGRVIPFWLLVYIPSLNPLERVWRFLEQKLAGHRCGNDIDVPVTTAATTLGRLEAHVHADPSPSVRLVEVFRVAA